MYALLIAPAKLTPEATPNNKSIPACCLIPLNLVSNAVGSNILKPPLSDAPTPAKIPPCSPISLYVGVCAASTIPFPVKYPVAIEAPATGLIKPIPAEAPTTNKSGARFAILLAFPVLSNTPGTSGYFL